MVGRHKKTSEQFTESVSYYLGQASVMQPCVCVTVKVILKSLSLSLTVTHTNTHFYLISEVLLV